jgi:ABC-2 type transport system permease protein
MNPLNRFFFAVVMLPGRIYRRMGINLEQLRSILRVKLIMDDRRPPSIMAATRRPSNKPVKYASVGTMVVSVFIGLAYLLAFVMGRDEITRMTFFFTFFFFMLSASLISDFTSVLIDLRDTFIILPKPVNDRTVVMARLLHILIHVCRIVLPMALPGFIYLGFRKDWGAALLLLPFLFLLTAFSIFFINALYLLILRVTTPAKFRSIIAYIQIIFAIVFYGSYQLFPRMATAEAMRDFSLEDYPVIIAYPMYWFAAGWKLLYHLEGTTQHIISALLALVVPVLGILAVIRYLAPTFNNKLALMGSGSSEGAPSSRKVARRQKKSGGYSSLLARLFTSNRSERAGFLFTWKMMGRSRDFKLKVYPGIGYMAVYLFVVVFRNLDVSDFNIASNRGRLMLLTPVYISSLVLSMAVGQMVFSEKYKASWIYFILPYRKPGDLVLGASKAAILYFFLPIVVVVVVAGVVFLGPSMLPNIILAIFNQLLITAMLVYMVNRFFPFSMQLSNNIKRGSFFRNLLVLMFSGLVAVGHFAIFSLNYVVLICIFLSIAGTWLLFSSIRNISWDSIRTRLE